MFYILLIIKRVTILTCHDLCFIETPCHINTRRYALIVIIIINKHYFER